MQGQRVSESPQMSTDILETPNAAIGIYLRVLYALQLDDDILLTAKEDVLRQQLKILP